MKRTSILSELTNEDKGASGNFENFTGKKKKL